MGSAALYHLARRGLRVLGLEPFGVAHDRGSSHGQTRIIRKAYFEHPAYVPLLHRAYTLWGELEAIVGRQLFWRTGLLLSGPPGGPIIGGVERAGREHRLAIERLTPDEAAARFEGFSLPASDTVLFEPDAGFLRVEECVRAHVNAALMAGASLNIGRPVDSWSARGDEVIVRSGEAEYSTRSLVVTAGAWAGCLLSDAGFPLEVRRKVVFWYQPADDTYDLERGCPVYGFDTAEGFMYGFPAIDASGVKVAQHSGGRTVDDPGTVERGLLPGDEEPVRTFVQRYLPRLRPVPRQHSVCLYTMTPDEHFIIDRHPGHSNVVLAAGFSGHGFKFASVVGSILADLVEKGETGEPIAFLSATREALRAGC